MEIGKSKIEQMENVINIQSDDGNWNYNPYMLGMLNGMLIIQSIITGRDPDFKNPPDEWLRSKGVVPKSVVLPKDITN